MRSLARRMVSRVLALRPPAVQLAILERPRGARDLVTRVVVLAAVVAAAVTPVFLGRGSGDLSQGASAAFLQQQAELEHARAQLEAIREDGEAGSEEGQAAASRVAELEAATRLGYLPRDDDETRVGGQAPDFRLLTLEGEPFRMSELGQPVILNFWASWCAPCVEEMPDFELVHAEFGDRLALIGVNDGEDLATALEFQERLGVTYAVLLDPTTQLTGGPYRLIGRPTTFYIDGDGVIREVRVGIHSLEEMRRLAGELVGAEVAQRSERPETRDYGEQALDLIESGRANFGVARGLLEDWSGNPDLFEDPGWRRNIVAQTRIWQALAERAEMMTAPRSAEALHGELKASLAAITVAGAGIRQAVDGAGVAELRVAGQLFGAGVDEFELVAGELEGVVSGG